MSIRVFWVFLGLAALIGREGAAQTLSGRAILPAKTFAPGPVSGQLITGTNGVTTPFPSQPVQGISSILRASDGYFYGLCDNGFGAKANSADFLLRFYRLSRDFKTAEGGAGTLQWKDYVSLNDADKKIPFPVVADQETMPGPNGKPIAVPAEVRENRLLTGADFDPESFVQGLDGSFWIGDEFGPFILHADRNGKLLGPPLALEGVASPDDPLKRPATIGRSRGFEGLAISPEGDRLFAALEGGLTADEDKTQTWIYEMNLDGNRFTGQRWAYPLEPFTPPEKPTTVGDITCFDRGRFLVLEHDGGQGANAKIKRVYAVNLAELDANGKLVKTLVADLMALRDPNEISGGRGFSFPFTSTESVIALDDKRIGVLNDNNFPFGSGREPGKPEDTEFIIVTLDRPLR